MEDGRIVDFAGKRRMNKTAITGTDGSLAVQLDFRNGATRLFTLPPAMISKFALHGAEQKLGDETAGLKGANGTEADIEDCVLAIDDLIDRLYNGEWNMRRESNGLAGTSVLIRALVEQSGKSVERIKEFLAPKTQAEKLALRNNEKLKPIVDRLEAERLSKKPAVNTDSMLEELDSLA